MKTSFDQPFEGAILGRSTLKHLIESEELRISYSNQFLSYKQLVDNDLIDETSINLNIGELFSYSPEIKILDIQKKYDLENSYNTVELDSDGCVLVKPQQLLLGKTYECIQTPFNVVGFIYERRTSAGNLGITIKGFIPPGLRAERVRFTLHNAGLLPVKIYIAKIAPMKAIFQSLTSEEVYGSERIPRVSNDQFYSSGAGDLKGNSMKDEVAVSFNHKEKTVKGKKTIVNFTLEKTGTAIIKKIKIYPLLSKDIYSIVSVSPGWKLKLKKDKQYKSKKNQPGEYIYIEQPIQSNSKIYGMFEIIFLENYISNQFKIIVECIQDSNIKISIKPLGEFLPITVRRSSFSIIGEFKQTIISAFIAAVLYGIFSNFRENILKLIENIFNYLVNMLG